MIDHAVGGLPASAPLVSKGGVHALTKSLAAELASDGIRVNPVAPGGVRTPLHEAVEVVAFGEVALLNRVLEDVLDKDPSTAFVVIEEVDLDSWGIGGLSVEEFRRRRARKSH